MDIIESIFEEEKIELDTAEQTKLLIEYCYSMMVNEFSKEFLERMKNNDTANWKYIYKYVESIFEEKIQRGEIILKNKGDPEKS
jgi:ribosomal protein S20